MFLKPAAGLLVRDPISRVHLGAAGEEKPDSAFWLRRLRDGDVVLATPGDVAPAPAHAVEAHQ